MTFFALSERQETGFDHYLGSMSAKILAWDVVLGKEAVWYICTYIHTFVIHLYDRSLGCGIAIKKE